MPSDEDNDPSPRAPLGTVPRPRPHPTTAQQQAMRRSLSGASAMLARPEHKKHTFEVRDGQAHAQVHDTLELRAAFLHHCASSMRACEMQLAVEGPFMSAQQFTAMARGLDLVEPEGERNRSWEEEGGRQNGGLGGGGLGYRVLGAAQCACLGCVARYPF